MVPSDVKNLGNCKAFRYDVKRQLPENSAPVDSTVCLPSVRVFFEILT